MQKVVLPKSVVGWWDPVIIAGVAIGGYAVLSPLDISHTDLAFLLSLLVMGVLFPLELWRAPWRKITRVERPWKDILRDSYLKWCGIMLELALLLLWWGCVKEYARGYMPFWVELAYVLPWVPFLAFGLIVFTEWWMGASQDHAYHFGRLATGDWHDTNWKELKTALFALFVKGFFLPLNVAALVSYFSKFRGKEHLLTDGTWPQAVVMLDHMIFALLVVAIIPGYVLSARLLGTEIKAVSQRGSSWWVTFLCYPPVNRGTRAWFGFSAGGAVLPWVGTFGETGVTSVITGLALLLGYLVHYWGEAATGLRASHLTNRGIITNGPFRFCKHPVYVSKCWAWGICFLPFLSADTALGNIRNTLAFLAFCAVYATRAWVEERLLSADPDYVAYGLWMDEHGWFWRVGRWIPLFSYRWRLERWRAVSATGC